MPGEDSPRPGADRPGRLDELVLTQAEHLPANHPGHGQPARRPDRNQQRQHVRYLPGPAPREHQVGRAFKRRLKRQIQQHHQKNVRQPVQHIDDAHHRRIDPPAEIPGQRAPQHADDHRQQRRRDPDRQTDRPAQQASPHQRSAVAVRAQRLLDARRPGRQLLGLRIKVGAVVLVLARPRKRDKARGGDQKQKHRADPAGAEPGAGPRGEAGDTMTADTCHKTGSIASRPGAGQSAS